MFPGNNGKGVEKWDWEGKEANNVHGIKVRHDNVGRASEFLNRRQKKSRVFMPLQPAVID